MLERKVINKLDKVLEKLNYEHNYKGLNRSFALNLFAQYFSNLFEKGGEEAVRPIINHGNVYKEWEKRRWSGRPKRNDK